MKEETTVLTPVHAQIERLAYQYWESAGRPDGRDLDYWLIAEAEILGTTLPAEALDGDE